MHSSLPFRNASQKQIPNPPIIATNERINGKNVCVPNREPNHPSMPFSFHGLHTAVRKQIAEKVRPIPVSSIPQIIFPSLRLLFIDDSAFLREVYHNTVNKSTFVPSAGGILSSSRSPAIVPYSSRYQTEVQKS